MLPPELLDEILKFCDLDSLSNCALANTDMLPIARHNLYHTLVYDWDGRNMQFMDLHNTAPLLTHTRRLVILFDDFHPLSILPDLLESLVAHGQLEAITASIYEWTDIMMEVLLLPSMNRVRLTNMHPDQYFTNYPHLKDLTVDHDDLVIGCGSQFRLDTLRVRLGRYTDEVCPQHILPFSTVRRVTLDLRGHLNSHTRMVNALMDMMRGVTHISLRVDLCETMDLASFGSIFSQMQNLTSLVVSASRPTSHRHILRLSVTFMNQLHETVPLQIFKLRIHILEDYSVSGQEEAWYGLVQATKRRGVELEVHFVPNDIEDHVFPIIIEGVDRIVIHNIRSQIEDEEGWALLKGESTDL